MRVTNNPDRIIEIFQEISKEVSNSQPHVEYESVTNLFKKFWKIK